jgi:thiamine pyrophosphokinase
MDSFTKKESDDFELVYEPDQESNDLEKALRRAITEGSRNVVVLGATGKRLDQTLKNLSVLKQFNDKFESLIFRDNHLDTFLLPNDFSKELKIGTQISLFPLSGVVSGIHTEGLKYPLNNEKLINGVRDGSSNEVVASPVHITHREGDLLMFVVTD